MKKLLAASCAALLLAAAAEAETVSVGNYSLVLPSGYETESGTTDDGDTYVCYYSETDGIDLYVYVREPEGDTLSDVTAAYAKDYNAAQSGSTVINGVEAGYFVTTYTDSDGTLNNVGYLLLDGNEEVLLDFYFEDAAVSQKTADIMNTLQAGAAPVSARPTAAAAEFSDNTVSLGGTGLVLTLPDTFEADELTDDDIKDDIVAVWYDDTCDLIVYCYAADGYTAEELAQDYAESFGGTAEGSVACGAVTLEAVTGTLTEDGQTDAFEIYAGVKDGQALVLMFGYEAGQPRPASIGEALSSIR